ncbi:MULTISPECIES: hypothetical protein [Rhodopseudomonas]|uniref:Uncharacterized protein n=1 Tax=Rhodopseudomonas palustris TaxID=1076 RepID=A0A0D7F4X5_RHOPL|nr:MULTISPECIES: hypothetical protein [Rhodopseudomonas]KIZ47840.1 hypothetical protein OO17_02165 [Rhodopseudomonas palustris]MDF3811043.1 hypothetical protein [Rhodopseudomonas sp. BAL398]WOK15939.1 hypothetical protein RBJ75_17400 [Rhodopseudomonas sp. BAL398]
MTEIDFDTPNYIVPAIPGIVDPDALQRKVEANIAQVPGLALRLQRWGDTDAAAEGKRNMNQERIAELKVPRGESIQRIAYLQRHIVPGGKSTPDIDAEIAAETAKVKTLDAEIARLQAANKVAFVSPLRRVLSAIDKATGDLIAHQNEVTVPAGSTPIAELDKRISAIENRRAKIADLRATTPTLAELLSGADADLERQRAKRESPNVAALFNMRARGWTQGLDQNLKVFSFGEIKWPTLRVFDGIDFADAPDTDALIRHVFHDQIRAYIHDQIKAKFDESKAMPAAKRNAAIAALEAEIFELQYEAGAFAATAEADGAAVRYPTDMDPLAIIGFKELPRVARPTGKSRQIVDEYHPIEPV